MRVIIAARLSRKQQRGEEGIGLDTQDERAREFCEREGHDVVTVTRDTISGSKAPMDRKQLGPWVSDPARMALYDGVVAYKSDRLSRGTDVDWSRIETWAADNGKRLIIVGPDGGIQYPARHDSDFWQWTAMKRQAGNELESIRERITRAHTAIRTNSGFIGKCPWGYTISGDRYSKHIVPSDAGRKYIPEIYRRVIDGESLASIARWLESETGEKFWVKTLARMVRSPVYRGRQVDLSGKVIHECEPLVDARTWRLAGEALANRPKRGPANAENRALLAGILFCGHPACTAGPDSPMYRRNGYRYRCYGRGARREGCGNSVSVLTLDRLVDMCMRADKDEIMETKVEPGHDYQAEIDDVKLKIRDLASQDLEDDEYDAELKRLRAERDRLQALPVVADQIIQKGTGESYRDKWKRLGSPQARREWMTSRGLSVRAHKDDAGYHVQIVDAMGRVVYYYDSPPPIHTGEDPDS